MWWVMWGDHLACGRVARYSGNKQSFTDQLGPKARQFTQPRASPWENGSVFARFSGPTGQRFAERLARWAESNGSYAPIPQGDVLGLANCAPWGQTLVDWLCCFAFAWLY